MISNSTGVQNTISSQISITSASGISSSATSKPQIQNESVQPRNLLSGIELTLLQIIGDSESGYSLFSPDKMTEAQKHALGSFTNDMHDMLKPGNNTPPPVDSGQPEPQSLDNRLASLDSRLYTAETTLPPGMPSQDRQLQKLRNSFQELKEAYGLGDDVTIRGFIQSVSGNVQNGTDAGGLRLRVENSITQLAGTAISFSPENMTEAQKHAMGSFMSDLKENLSPGNAPPKTDKNNKASSDIEDKLLRLDKKIDKAGMDEASEVPMEGHHRLQKLQNSFQELMDSFGISGETVSLQSFIQSLSRNLDGSGGKGIIFSTSA